jgi:hypothetical protein
MVVLGAGLGFASSAYILSVQNAVPWNLRGVATASTQFFRTIGGTIGIAVMGSILNAQMALLFTPIFARFANVAARLPRHIAPANVLLTPELRTTLPVAFLSQLQAALAQGLFWVYLLIFILAIVGVATSFLLPGGRADQYSYKPAQSEDEAKKNGADTEFIVERLANIG